MYPVASKICRFKLPLYMIYDLSVHGGCTLYTTNYYILYLHLLRMLGCSIDKRAELFTKS